MRPVLELDVHAEAELFQVEAPPVNPDRVADTSSLFDSGSPGFCQSTISTIEAGITQIRSFGTGAANVATVVVPIAAQLTKLVADAKATVSSLEAVKGPFEKAVKDSDTCQALMPDQNQ